MEELEDVDHKYQNSTVSYGIRIYIYIYIYIYICLLIVVNVQSHVIRTHGILNPEQ